MSANIYKAINEVMKEVGYVQKTGKNDFHGYKYAGESDDLSVVRPAMVKHGLVLFPRVMSCTGPDKDGITNVIVHYDIAHISGECIKDAVIVAGQGGDISKAGKIGDKGVYKALTGANKYAVRKLFQMETGDDPEASAAPNEHDDRPKPVEKKGTPATARRPSDETVPF